MRRLLAERLVFATGVIVVLMCALFAYLRVASAATRKSESGGVNWQVFAGFKDPDLRAPVQPESWID